MTHTLVGEKPISFANSITDILNTLIPETEDDVVKIKDALKTILFPKNTHDDIALKLKDRILEINKCIKLHQNEKNTNVLIENLFHNKFVELDAQFPTSDGKQYWSMIYDRLKNFTPRTKEEVEAITNTLALIKLSEEKTIVEQNYQDKFEHFRYVYNFDDWCISPKREDAYRQLIKEVIQYKIDFISKMPFEEIKLKKRDDSPVKLESPKKPKFDLSIDPEELLSQRDKNIRALIKNKVIPDHDLSSERFDYSPLELSVFDNNDLVQSMLLDDGLSFEDAIAIQLMQIQDGQINVGVFSDDEEVDSEDEEIDGVGEVLSNEVDSEPGDDIGGGHDFNASWDE